MRRFTGTLIVPMVLHGLWDGALFSVDHSGAESPSLPSVMYIIAIVLSLVALVKILRERPDVEPQLST